MLLKKEKKIVTPDCAQDGIEAHLNGVSISHPFMF